MALLRICESVDFFVDYDTDRGMYRLSAFKPDVDYIDKEYWFDAYEEKELGVIFPQTIGDITFYSKTELFEWVENMQKEFCSPPTGFVRGGVDKPIKIVFEGDVTVERNDYDIEVRKKFDCSYMSDEEFEELKSRLEEEYESE